MSTPTRQLWPLRGVHFQHPRRPNPRGGREGFGCPVGGRGWWWGHSGGASVPGIGSQWGGLAAAATPQLLWVFSRQMSFTLGVGAPKAPCDHPLQLGQVHGAMGQVWEGVGMHARHLQSCVWGSWCGGSGPGALLTSVLSVCSSPALGPGACPLCCGRGH